MEKIRDKVLDCKRQILQLLILVIVFFIPKLIDISGKINQIFNGSNPDFENVRYYYLMKMGNWGVGLVFFNNYIVLYL